MLLPKTIFVALQVADGLSTHKALSLGAEEKNPLLRTLIGVLGEIPALALMKTTSAFGTLRLLNGVPHAGVVLWGINLFYASVVLSNINVISESNNA